MSFSTNQNVQFLYSPLEIILNYYINFGAKTFFPLTLYTLHPCKQTLPWAREPLSRQGSLGFLTVKCRKNSCLSKYKLSSERHPRIPYYSPPFFPPLQPTLLPEHASRIGLRSTFSRTEPEPTPHRRKALFKQRLPSSIHSTFIHLKSSENWKYNNRKEDDYNVIRHNWYVLDLSKGRV